jgi:hypothetical protein
LTAAGGGVSQNAFIQPDGTFEFPKILPGDYLAGLTIGITPLRMVSVRVDKKDVHINMKAPVLLGHVSVDDGNPLPLSISGGAGIQFVGGGGRGGPLGSQFAVNPLAPLQEPLSLVQLRWRRTGPASEKQPNGQVQGSAMVRADGYFAFEAAPGKYEITAQQMPMGYYLKEVRQNPETSQFDVTLTTTPQASDPKGVTLSGRIAGLVSGAVEPKGVRIQMTNSRGGFSPGAPQRVAEVPIGADGAFSVRGVPPGTISLNLIPNSPLQMRIDVADRDLTL